MADVVIRISGEIKKFDDSLDKISKKTKAFESKLATAAKISGAAFAGLGVVIGSNINQFRKFDNEIRGVKTLLDESSFGAKGLEKGFSDLKKEQLALAASMPIGDLSKMNKALFDTISAGVPAAEAVKAVGVSAKLATAGLTDISIATDGLTSAMNAYQIAAGEAEVVASKFFTAQKFGKTTIAELASGFGLVGSSAQAAGISLNELLSAVSAVTTAGVRTNAAYTGLKAVIAGISKPTKEAVDEANRLGIEFNGAALRAKGLEEFLYDLSRANGFTKDSVTRLFGSVEAQNILFALTGNQAGNFTKTLRELGNETKTVSTLTDAYNTQSESVENQLKLLGQQFDVLQIKLGEKLAPTFLAVTKPLGKMIEAISSMSDESIQAIANITLLGAAFTGLGTVGAVAVIGLVKIRNAIVAIRASALLARTAGIAMWTGLTGGAALLLIYLPEIIQGFNALSVAVKKAFAPSQKEQIQAASTEIDRLNGKLNKLNKEYAESQKGSNFFGRAQAFIRRDIIATENALEKQQKKLRDLTAAYKKENNEQSQSLKDKADTDVQTEAAKSAQLIQLETERNILIEQQRILSSLNEEMRKDAEFAKTVEILGAEQAARSQAELNIYKNKKKYEEIKVKVNNQSLKKQISDKAAAVEAERQLEEQKLFLYADSINSISQITALGGRRMFEITKGLQLASALMSGYAAIQGALAAPPFWPLNAPNVITVGLKQAANVARLTQIKPTGFAEGGIVTGGVAGVDSVPAMLMPGELNVPTKNYDEAVNAIADQRVRESRYYGGEGGEGGSGTMKVEVELVGELGEIAEARIIENRTIGRGLGL